MVEVERNGVMVLVPGAWRVPDVLPLPEILEQGRKAVAETLTPAGDQGVAEVMMPLMLTTQVPATATMSNETVQSFYAAMASEYRRHLRDVPLDILKEAADACVRESEYFPAVAAFLRHAKPELEKRQRQAERIAMLIDARNRPQPKPREKSARELETREQRLRGGIATCRRFGRISTAIAWEHELAELEGREVEEWALEQPAPPIAPPAEEVRGTLPRDGKAWTKASDAAPKWQAGEPVYQKPAEEPPVPDEIPE